MKGRGGCGVGKCGGCGLRRGIMWPGSIMTFVCGVLHIRR